MIVVKKNFESVFMLKNVLTYKIISIMALALVLAGCEELNNPHSAIDQELQVKSETKWEVDINTEEKINKMLYKEYDIDGNVTLNIDYYKNGRINTKSTYSYDAKNKKVEKREIYDKSGNKINNSKVEYLMNNSGTVGKKIFYENDTVESVLTFNYDQNNNLVSQFSIDKNSDTTLKIEYDYQYNNHGNVVERTVNITGSNSKPVKRDSLNYIERKNLVEVFNYEGSVLNKVTSYVYNDQGLIQKEIITGADGALKRKFIYEYTYY